MRWALAVFYAVAGALHLATPQAFVLIVPGWAPWPYPLVLVTGVCELAGAAALLTQRLRAAAGVMLALYAICVFPANVKHALENVQVPGLPASWWYHAPRLALQPVLVWWALYGAGVVDWPFRRGLAVKA
jgi:uncharacterized membrane protein